MSISHNRALRSVWANLCAAVLCALFGAVYEHFSHEVYSRFMIYAFAIPLVLGAMPPLFLFRRGHTPSQACLESWNAGIATLTVGSLFQGALEIYGTTNRLTVLYPLAGGLLLAAGFVLLFRGRFVYPDEGHSD